MGIYAHQFYFKNGLPKVKEIKDKFYEISGLKLEYTPVVFLDRLTNDQNAILRYWEKSIKESNKVYIHSTHFSCEGFTDIYLEDYMGPDSKTFYLEMGIRAKNMYFFNALVKTLHEIGGRTYTNHNHDAKETDEFIEQYLEPYHPHERNWKRIKVWSEMSEVEKAAFKGKYSE